MVKYRKSSFWPDGENDDDAGDCEDKPEGDTGYDDEDHCGGDAVVTDGDDGL